MKVVPSNDASAASRKYVDGKTNTKANKNDLNDYLKLDGTSQMQGDLKMNKKRISGLPSTPSTNDEATSKDYVVSLINYLPNLYLDRKGSLKMIGNLQMNDNRTTGLPNTPTSVNEGVNKKYVDDSVKKSNIKPSRTAKNVFQYLMDDVNEWTTEYGVKVRSIGVLNESPHSWIKKF